MLRFNVRAAVTPDAATALTLIQVAALAAHRVIVWGFNIDGVGDTPASANCLVWFQRQSNAGVGGNAGTIAELSEEYTETVQAVPLHGVWATTEPAATGDPFYYFSLHEQGGRGPIWFPAGHEIDVPGGTRIAMRYIKASAHPPLNVELYCSE